MAFALSPCDRQALYRIALTAINWCWGSTEELETDRVFRDVDAMAMGRKRPVQQPLFVYADELVGAPRHRFYEKLNELLDGAGFDTFVEHVCAPFFAQSGKARRISTRPCRAPAASRAACQGCVRPGRCGTPWWNGLELDADAPARAGHPRIARPSDSDCDPRATCGLPESARRTS